MVETRDTIKFCVKLVYKPTEKFSLLQRGRGVLEIRKNKIFKWHTRFKQGQKIIQDGPMSGCRKIISGKLETHYEICCLGSFPNMTRLGTRPYPKDWLVITRSVSEKMGNILKIYEVLVLCAPTYRYYDKTLTGPRHNVNVMACSG